MSPWLDVSGTLATAHRHCAGWFERLITDGAVYSVRIFLYRLRHPGGETAPLAALIRRLRRRSREPSSAAVWSRLQTGRPASPGGSSRIRCAFPDFRNTLARADEAGVDMDPSPLEELRGCWWDSTTQVKLSDAHFGAQYAVDELSQEERQRVIRNTQVQQAYTSACRSAFSTTSICHREPQLLTQHISLAWAGFPCLLLKYLRQRLYPLSVSLAVGRLV